MPDSPAWYIDDGVLVTGLMYDYASSGLLRFDPLQPNHLEMEADKLTVNVQDFYYDNWRFVVRPEQRSNYACLFQIDGEILSLALKKDGSRPSSLESVDTGAAHGTLIKLKREESDLRDNKRAWAIRQEMEKHRFVGLWQPIEFEDKGVVHNVSSSRTWEITHRTMYTGDKNAYMQTANFCTDASQQPSQIDIDAHNIYFQTGDPLVGDLYAVGTPRSDYKALYEFKGNSTLSLYIKRHGARPKILETGDTSDPNYTGADLRITLKRR